MYFKNRISTNIPLGEKEKGMVEKFFPFLAGMFGKKDHRILSLLAKTGQSFGDIGINSAVSLEVNGSSVSGIKNCRDNFHGALASIQEYDKTIRKIHLVGRKKENDLEITSIVKIELLPDEDSASVMIENHGMVQIPETVGAKTFEKDIQEHLEKGYLEKCERNFAKFTESMVRSFEKTYREKLSASKTEKTIIVPAKKDLKMSKFYNRKFSSEDRVCSPAFYNSTGVSPGYSYKGYTDPFEIYWWLLIFDYTGGFSGGNENFADSRGIEISKHEAASLVQSADQVSLSNDLAGSSSDFSSGRYETFPQAVEASRYDYAGSGHDKDDKDNKHTTDNSAAFVAGDGGGSHTSSSKSAVSSHDSDSGCSGGHNSSSCSGGSSCGGSSCSGGSSCGGGGCGGGGCGGG